MKVMKVTLRVNPPKEKDYLPLTPPPTARPGCDDLSRIGVVGVDEGSKNGSDEDEDGESELSDLTELSDDEDGSIPSSASSPPPLGLAIRKDLEKKLDDEGEKGIPTPPPLGIAYVQHANALLDLSNRVPPTPSSVDAPNRAQPQEPITNPPSELKIEIPNANSKKRKRKMKDSEVKEEKQKKKKKVDSTTGTDIKKSESNDTSNLLDSIIKFLVLVQKSSGKFLQLQALATGTVSIIDICKRVSDLLDTFLLRF